MGPTTLKEEGTRISDADPARGTRRHDLDSLAGLDLEQLGALYLRGTTPPSLGALEGHPRGRMLAVRGLDHGPGALWIRRLAAAHAFPWGGKSFYGHGETGTGVNRVHLFGRHQLFPFLTSVRPSLLDGAPCVTLDYDLPDNPCVIRSIHDEVREVDAGLFLGPAMWKTEHRPRLVLWFALDTRAQAAPIGLPKYTA
jgi:hypothetical protein